MRGMWAGDKAIDPTYRPGVDALAAVDADLVRSAIHHAVGSGAALNFAATRDGGAVVLTLLDGPNRPKVYCSNVQELHQALTDLVASITTPPTATATAPQRGKR